MKEKEPCLFNRENFFCGETGVRDCLRVLDIKIHHPFTPESHKKNIPICTRRIEKYHDKGAGKRATDMCVQWQT
ncbi:MAG: hypothetical protein GY757_12990, partial [bacterium]|nr:hypothetical protein [bacterium]